MRPAYFEALTQAEVEEIDAASMRVLEGVGLQIELKRARDAFGEAGAEVDEGTRSVRIPEALVRWAIEQAPRRYSVYGADADCELEFGTGEVRFGGFESFLGALQLAFEHCDVTVDVGGLKGEFGFAIGGHGAFAETIEAK